MRRMSVAYKVITQDEMDDVIVRTFKANEMDLFAHTSNKQRFESMLQTLNDGEWKARVQMLLDETNSRIEEVQSILDATAAQLPDEIRIQASLARIDGR